MNIRLPEKDGTVYFIRVGEKNVVKIGYTRKDREYERLRDLQGMNHEKLELISLIEGVPESKEAELHKKFNHLNIRGEWFKLTKELLDYMKTNSRRV